MKLLIAISQRYLRVADGSIWTSTSYDHEMWQEHQAVFDELRILTRVTDVSQPPEGAHRADGPGIKFYWLPEWYSWRFPLLLPRMYAIARRAVEDSDALLLHSPSMEAEFAYFWGHRLNKPWAVECRGEQAMNADYLRNRGLRFSGLVGKYHRWQYQRHVDDAWGCVYVAEQLRRTFPPQKTSVHTEVISDLRLPPVYFQQPHRFSERQRPTVRIVNVGRLEAQKDLFTLLKSFRHVIESGREYCELHLIGDGPLRPQLETLTAELGLTRQVIFHGFVPWGASLFQLLDDMDLFVLTSLSEGMPRALLEAMAAGLPCLSTRVSGSTELLPDEALVPIGDSELLARQINGFLAAPELLDRLAVQCWERVQSFREHRLRAQKQMFLGKLKLYAEQIAGD
jgi:glycosyltransferase involved in cell wall biosynthesis